MSLTSVLAALACAAALTLGCGSGSASRQPNGNGPARAEFDASLSLSCGQELCWALPIDAEMRAFFAGEGARLVLEIEEFDPASGPAPIFILRERTADGEPLGELQRFSVFPNAPHRANEIVAPHRFGVEVPDGWLGSPDVGTTLSLTLESLDPDASDARATVRLRRAER